MNTEEYRKAANFWKMKDRNDMPAEQVKLAAENYIRQNSVCALATGAGDYVRCTPLEYSWHDGRFWIFTEGGEKFIGLEKNDNVSLAVFDRNPAFGELQSVQVTGKARLIEPMSEEYTAHAEYKKILAVSLQKLMEQGHPMHLLCIEPVRMDVLCSDFKKQGYEVRQTLIYDRI